MDKYIDIISSISLFNGLTKDELNKLTISTGCEIKKYEKNQIIHLQNEVCNFTDIVLTGKVSVQNIDENGNVLTVHAFTTRDIIGANIIFSGKNYYPMTVIAMSSVVILHINKDLILWLCQNNLNFMTKWMTIISDKAVILTEKINAIAHKTIRQCITDFLKYEYHIQKSNVIKLNISKKELAERLGIQRTSLSRELNKMRRDGLLEYDSKTITLKKIKL